MFIAHRGLYYDDVMENTIEAFDNAFNKGYLGIEFDVRLTKDMIPIVFHDSFLSRLTKNKGLIKNFTYEELNKIERKIPKLEDVIKRYNNKIMIIELKENIDILKYLDNRNTYYISSFNYNYLKKINKGNNIKIGLISYELNNIKNYNLDFIMILDTLYKINKNKYLNSKIEIIIYGIIGNPNSYDKNIKYII